MYEVEKNIKYIATSKTSFLRTLEIGESFTMPKNERTSVYQLSINAGIKTKTKSVNEHTIRVWRIE